MKSVRTLQRSFYSHPDPCPKRIAIGTRPAGGEAEGSGFNPKGPDAEPPPECADLARMDVGHACSYDLDFVEYFDSFTFNASNPYHQSFEAGRAKGDAIFTSELSRMSGLRPQVIEGSTVKNVKVPYYFIHAGSMDKIKSV